MSRFSRPALSLLSALSVLAAPANLSAQNTPPASPPPAPAPGKPAEEMVGPVVLRQENRDQVLDLYERWTGKTLLRPGALPEANITLTLDRLPKSEALRAIETLLSMHGIALSPLGDRFIKVSPVNLVRAEAPEFINGSTLDMPPSGRVAAKLFTLNFLRVSEFVQQAGQLLNPALGAAPVLFEKNNSVLFTDTVSNLQRIEQLLVSLDRPAAATMAVKAYTASNAKASDLVNKLRTLLGGPLAAQIGTATTYQADDRTNQIILISDPREQPFFDDLIARLDSEASPNTRSEVIFLKHATATDLEALLAKLVTGQTTAQQRDSGSSGRLSNSRLNPVTPAAPAAGGAAPTPAGVAAANAAVNAAAASEEFSSYLTIVADERSNAIVVAGTPNDIKLVSSLVNRLDVLLAQVRIEVVIAEVTLTDAATNGISSLGLKVENNKLTGFNGNFAGGSVLGTAGTDGSFASIVGGGSSYDLSGIVGLTTTPRNSNATILQTPSIVTTHNKEAELFVGETRPVISGTTTGSSGSTTGLTTSSTVTQQEIGVTLTVLPLIGANGDVQLEIEQRVEDIIDSVTIDGNDQPVVGRRTTTSYISAHNGDIIVLGGLQRESTKKSTSRLGPIPWIGDLLGTRSRSKTRTELVFFLRPTILTNTYLDNVEAMRRIDATKQGPKIREIIDHRPAAAPYVAPGSEISSPVVPASVPAEAPSPTPAPAAPATPSPATPVEDVPEVALPPAATTPAAE